MKAVKFRVTGRVQGVGYRHFVMTVADSLGIAGEVWNTRDGAVEGLAQGDRLSLFVAMLAKGPGYVSAVETSETDVSEAEGFHISSTR